MTFYIDLDGPILDVSEKYHQVYKTIVDGLGGVALPKETYWELKRQKTAIDDILERSKLTPSARAIYTSSRLEMIETTQFLRYDRLQPAAREILAELQNKHILYLVTLRTSTEALSHQLQWLQLRPFFQAVLSAPGASSNRHLSKVALVTSQGEISSEGGAIIGDTETDILAGKELNLTTVAVLNGIRTRQILENSQPDYIIETFADLSQCLPGI